MSFKLSNPYGVPAQQADAVLTQADPVSTTLYTVLDTTTNVRIQTVTIVLTWGVTQPDPLDVVFTIDGQTITHTIANPVSDTTYLIETLPYAAATAQGSRAMTGVQLESTRPYLYEGRSVKIQARVTWAVTQPTPMVCRVKYAKW